MIKFLDYVSEFIVTLAGIILLGIVSGMMFGVYIDKNSLLALFIGMLTLSIMVTYLYFDLSKAYRKLINIKKELDTLSK